MMTRLMIDAATRGKLRGLTEPMEFTDESGRVLGHFVPAANADPREPQISQEEIDRRLRAGGGRSLADILKELEQRG